MGALAPSYDTKLNTACPNILVQTNFEHGLVLSPNSNFEQYVQQAHTIAHIMQANMPLKPLTAAVTPRATISKRSRPGPADTPPTNAPAHRQPKGPSDKQLLVTYLRCAECGWQVAKDETHSGGHVCDPQRLHGLDIKIRIQLGRGLHPNVMISKPKSVRFQDKPGNGDSRLLL